MTNLFSPWIEVDLDAVASNVGVLLRHLRPGSRLMGVVKANAYGHGATEVARTLVAQGAQSLGVARFEEGVSLREAGIAAPVLVFGPTPPDCVAELLRLSLTPTVGGLDEARALGNAVPNGYRLGMHLKVDTGMGRLGCLAQPDAGGQVARAQAQAVAHEAACIAGLPGVALRGVYTHFACADAAERTPTTAQFGAFAAVLDEMAALGLRPFPRHAANSAAILRHPETHLDLARAGIAIYGYGGSPESGLRPALSLKTRIVHLKSVPAGTTIGYGMDHRAPVPTTIATVALGYGDGYDRRHSGVGRMLVRGVSVPIVGRVCMDLTLLDVGGVPGAAVGDEVVALGRQGSEDLRADTVGSKIGTIPYEVVSSLTPRVRREHRGGERIEERIA